MVGQALDQRQEAYTAIRSEIVNFVPGNATTVLDVGCSNGALGKHLKTLAVGRKVFGIEFDANFVEIASRSLDSVVKADVNTLDWHTVFEGEKFDCMIFADVLEHLVDPKRCLSLAQQRLSPGGCVIVSLPNVRHVSALWNVFFKGTFPRRDRGIFDRTHLRWFTYADAEGLLQESGLQISSQSFALRWRDQGGGFFNRLLNKLPFAIQSLAPVREFFAYQICFRAEAKSIATCKGNGNPSEIPKG